jgi:prepilin-type processing-associated H-X9-DG protein
LVELLVVIGIIALLISILLPSLNRARQQAYLVDCQSRMRQMGQAIQMYTVENKGFLPPSGVDAGNAAGQWTPAVVWDEWTLPAFLTRTLGGQGDPTPGATHGHVGVQFLSPIFTDKDVSVEAMWGITHPNHYGFNPAMFPGIGWNITVLDQPGGSPIPGSPPEFVRMTKVRHSAEVVAGWDCYVPPSDNYGGSTYWCAPCIQDINAQDAYWASAKFLLGASDSYYDTSVAIGDAKAPNIKAKLASLPYGEVDFRHVGGKLANFLYLDGHVESHRVGELKVRDFCFSWQ